MTDLTPDQLTATTNLADGDLLLIYVVADTVMRKLRWDVFQDLVIDALGNSYLEVANNLSDLQNASVARGNLGLGTAAVLASGALFQVANNLSEIANAATARSNLGAAAASAPAITGGMTLTGPVKGNINAVASTSIDVSIGEFHTKSMSSNTTYTFDNATASKGQGFVLELTVSSSATPTWPASVKWEGGTAPLLANGKHVLGFLTFDGGTTWDGFIIGQLFS
jgi:hypothetical protein